MKLVHEIKNSKITVFPLLFFFFIKNLKLQNYLDTLCKKYLKWLLLLNGIRLLIDGKPNKEKEDLGSVNLNSVGPQVVKE